MGLSNLYESDVSFKERVCILGPGPNGKEYYRSIPKDFTVLALNRAIFISDVDTDYWMINHTHQDWFPEAHRYWQGSRIYRKATSIQFLEKVEPEDDWYYYDPPEQQLDYTKPEMIDQGVFMGGTVAATALQIAWHFGAKVIWLCGVDMSGYGYWDGTQNPEDRQFHGEKWAAIPVINSLVSYLQEEKGLHIKSLSPTKLDIARADLLEI